VLPIPPTYLAHQGAQGSCDGKDGRPIPCRPGSLRRKAWDPFLGSLTPASRWKLPIGPKSNSFPLFNSYKFYTMFTLSVFREKPLEDPFIGEFR
jgi:hypothetical protein